LTESESIPNKLYFKIGEVSELTGIKPHVLRYWETEFNIVRPMKTASNQRLYKRKEVEMIFEIKNLLYEERFTIAGAKKALQERSKTKEQKQLTMGFENSEENKEVLRKIRKEIMNLKKLVEE
jgi:DNA-binding transcriptional MerR regulator